MRPLLCALWLGLSACGPAGAEWLKVDLSTEVALNGIHGSSASDVYVVGRQGLLRHFDGVAWRAVDSGGPADLNAVFALSPSEVWVVGDGVVLRGNKSGFAKVPNAPGSDFKQVWGLASNDMYLATSSDLYWFNGSAFEKVTRNQGSSSYRISVDRFSGTPATGLWMVADGRLLKGGGGSFVEVAVGTTGSWDLVTVASASDVWVWDGATKVLRFDGTRWNYVQSPISDSYDDLIDGWANGSTDAWFCGEKGRILQWDGTELKRVVEGGYSAPKMLSIWGASASDMWAVGEKGWVLRRFVTP